ncbi:Glutathione peroxidase [Purpureocillium takamizusanense]|uniref:Glutathione peroxidase n=1 Tax=Purpureocillium takamizusanense TaxID=2060973 RepID=A0A9Q8VAH6_9HYPO|nr:Glutathione peroxidase [Purpureocillium takamizusanense]UNI18693.1 Glutathione peroxidase [Purpureocillium takamizusanense]
MNRVATCHHIANRQLSCAIRKRPSSLALIPSIDAPRPARRRLITNASQAAKFPKGTRFHYAPRHFATMASATGFYDFKPLDKRGQEVPLADYKGKVVLVVNTASKCGFTPQYAGLETLYKSIKDKHPDDFVILGFPCNQFGSQEPGSDDEIQNFCQVNYGVTFPIMHKIDVNGDKADPLYEWLKAEKPGLMGLKRIKWNFEKFLVDRNGQVKGRWASTTKPEALEKPILYELEKKQ